MADLTAFEIQHDGQGLAFDCLVCAEYHQVGQSWMRMSDLLATISRHAHTPGHRENARVHQQLSQVRAGVGGHGAAVGDPCLPAGDL